MKNRTRRIRKWIRARRLPILLGCLALFLGAISLIVAANRVCQKIADGKIFRSLDSIPKRDVGLVLGTGKLTRRGNPNLHFNQRIKAAAALYRSGKVRYLLVSGDNHIAGYDEPSDMREALMATGVPDSAITRDYAGFRTLDSVVRAKVVFGLARCTIISEEFHCRRAIWIAQRHGLDAVAFAAPDVDSRRWSWRVKAREHLARAWCAMDLYVLHRGPKFDGPKEPIIVTASRL
ncbi:MAG: ElyC/SanA/YdcF family protein [Verrucomicrobiota bacterium]